MTKNEIEEASRNKDLLVDFYAAWCGPCKLMSQKLDTEILPRLAKVQVVRVDTDMAPGLAAEFGVTSIPTIFCYRKGTCVGKFIGVVPSDDVVSAFSIEKTETITVDVGLNKKEKQLPISKESET